MKQTLFLFSFFILPAALFSQVYDIDALKFARQQTAGTARSMGAVGAFGSVGADLSSTLYNPAGIALYRSSDVSLGIGIHPTATNSKFLNQERSESNTRFTFNYVGFVYAGAINKKKSSVSFSSKDLEYVNFAITYNKISNFNRTLLYSGLNRNNSYAGAWVKELNSLSTAPGFENASVAAVLGFQNQTVNFDTIANKYRTYIDTPIFQNGKISERGSVDEVNINLGFNINDKVFFAFDAGIPFLSYSTVNEFSEVNTNDSAARFSNYRYVQEYRTNGVGFNLKLGLIYRPVAWYRTGIAFHSPTWYRLDENYYAYLDEKYDGLQYKQEVDAAPFRYNINTPMKGIFSNSFYFKQYGFLSVDYEFQNFGANKYRFSDYKEAAEVINQTTKAKYGFGHTVRVGVEGAVKWFRVRGGYAWQSSPFKTNVAIKGSDEQRHLLSLGVGYRGKSFFADVAFQQMRTNSYYQQYASNDGNEPAVKTKNIFNNIMLTLGWRFGSKKQ
jgi:hypothetical protein